VRHVAIMAALIVWVFAAPAAGQLRAASAELSGRVADQTEGVLPGTLVTIVNLETGERQTQTTGPDGRFAFPPLPVGRYPIVSSL
jgi:hypothetical protein